MIRDLKKSQALSDALNSAFPHDVLIEALKSALDATITISRVARDGTTTTVERPDANARIKAIQIILAYTVGLPVQRISSADTSPPGPQKSEEEHVNEMIASPATIRAFARIASRMPGGRKALHDGMTFDDVARRAERASEGGSRSVFDVPADQQ